mgnify:CR=1 FL=1
MIAIKKLKKSDIGYLVESLNNPSIMKLIASAMPLSFEEASRICTGYYQDAAWFVIKNNQLQRNIGLVSLLRISPDSRSADLSITISEERDRHKGYGTEAMKQILHYAFCELHLHRIQLEVLHDNTAAESMYRKIGFHFEGLRRDAFCNGNTYKDMLLFSILKNEWSKPT